jgi:hypothetical protein
LERVRQQHNDYLAKFYTMITDVKAILKDPRNKNVVGFAVASTVTQTVLQGMQVQWYCAMSLINVQYLSDWSSKVLMQAAYKYAKPNIDPSVDSTVDYERVVRYNYKSDEKYALVEFLAMIKGLAGTFSTLPPRYPSHL